MPEQTRRLMPLRRTLFLAFAAIVSLSLLTAALVWGITYYRHSQLEAENRLKETAFLTSLRITEYLQRQRQTVALLAHVIDLRHERDPAALERLLEDTRVINPGLQTMLVSRLDGTLLAASPSTTKDGRRVVGLIDAVRDRSYFRIPATTGQSCVTDAFLGRGFGADPISAVSSPLFGTTGRFDGIVEASLDLSKLSEFQQAHELIKSGKILILDGQQHVVYGADTRRYPALSTFSDLPLTESSDAVGVSLSRGSLPARAGAEAQKVLCGWAVVHVPGMSSDWKVLVIQDLDIINQLIRSQLIYLGLGLLGSLVLVAVAAQYIARRVTRPVEELARTARRIAAEPGLAALPAVPTRVRELEDMQSAIHDMSQHLQESFNHLSRNLAEKETLTSALLSSRSALEKSHRDLESRVTLRTAELQEAMERMAVEVKRRTHSEQMLEESNRTLELIARGTPLRVTLTALLQALERDAANAISALMLLDASGHHLQNCVSVGLPAAYIAAIDGIEIGPSVGSCGTAAYRREQVIVSDIATDPLWASYRELALSHGLRSCWSTPIISGSGRVLGTFALYGRTSGMPTSDQIQFVDLAAHTAAIAIEQDRARQEMELLSQQLRQSQKLEAVGTLAGGVAHGFNNLLVPILGYAELLQSHPHLDAAARANLEEIVRASRQARTLIQQMMAFSRQHEPTQSALRLGSAIEEVQLLLRVSIPSNISLEIEPLSEEPSIRADASQIQHILMNLCTNAIQAMSPAGGVLTLRRSVVQADGPSSGLPSTLPLGTYMCLEVHDTGCGIPREVRDRIFEPFFTTKPVGKGTGLGLSVVHGIVTASGGAIAVESEVGKGSTFRVYLPVQLARKPEVRGAPAPAPASPAPARNHLLLVDDEAAVARFTGVILQRQGYTVKIFGETKDALAWFTAQPGQADLLVTDVNMPGMNGVDLAMAISALRRDLPILFVTGYGRIETSRLRDLPNRHAVLAKPFDTADLLASIRKLLLEQAPRD